MHINKQVLSIFLIAVLGFSVYAGALNAGFIWDDFDLVKNNVYIRSFSNIAMAFSQNIGAGVGKKGNFWRPLQLISYMFDYALWGLTPRGYRLTNILLHILTAVGIYLFLKALFGDNLLSLLTSLLFVVHPVHTEAVTYIAGRADPLAAFFTFMSLLFYVKAVRLKKRSSYFIALACCLLALLSREGSIIIPALILVYHVAFKKRVELKAFLPFVGLSLGYVILRLTVLKSLLPGASACPYSTFVRLPGVFVALAEYLRLLILPFHLHMEYGYKLFTFSDIRALAGIGIAAAALLFIWKARNKNRVVFFSLTWFFIALLPVSGLYPINSYMAEHWLYLPSVGFFLIVASLLCRLLRAKGLTILGILILLGLVGFYSWITVGQNRIWKDPVVFYQRLIRFSPDTPKAYNNLALIYYEKGDKESAYRMFKKAIEVDPQYVGAYSNLANLYKHDKKYDLAIAAYKKAIAIDSEFVYAYNNLALVYYQMGRLDEAVALLKKTVAISPYYVDGYNNLGTCFLAKGELEEAAAAYRKAIELNPGYAKAVHNLGIVYNSMGQRQKALNLFTRAIELDPGYAEAYNNLAILYVYKRDFQKAVFYADKARALGFPNPDLDAVLKPYR